MERLTSSAAGPASSFERTGAGSSCTLRGQRSRSPERAWSSKGSIAKSSVPLQSGSAEHHCWRERGLTIGSTRKSFLARAIGDLVSR